MKESHLCFYDGFQRFEYFYLILSLLTLLLKLVYSNEAVENYVMGELEYEQMGDRLHFSCMSHV